MMIFHAQSMVFFATPKTGSTAIEAALRPFASISVDRPTNLRHLQPQRFDLTFGIGLDFALGKRLDRVALIRDPLDRLGSYYRYRQRDAAAGTPTSTHGMTFPDFVAGCMADDPPPPCRIGTQWSFLTDRRGDMTVTRLFAYERPDQWQDHFRTLFDAPIEFPTLNVSPRAKLELPADLARDWHMHSAREAELHTRALDAPVVPCRRRHRRTTEATEAVVVPSTGIGPGAAQAG